jgi:hypothetical protein
MEANPLPTTPGKRQTANLERTVSARDFEVFLKFVRLHNFCWTSLARWGKHVLAVNYSARGLGLNRQPKDLL